MSPTLETILEQARQLPEEELAELLKEVEEMLDHGQAGLKPGVLDYKQFLGSGKGLYKDVAEVDNFIRKERDEWED